MSMKILFLATTLLVSLSGRVLKAVERPDLVGKVVDLNGKPVADATVFIYSGGPRLGRSSFCPTCYPDCRKHAQTDAKGEFLIPALDPNLLFRLLVVNKDYKPLFQPKTDPLKGPVEIKIETRKMDFPDHQALRGQVVNTEGLPVSKAIVNFDFFGGRDANCGGQCDGVDMVAVADEDGRFTIGSERKFDWMSVAVEAPGFSRRKFFQLPSEKPHQLKMTEGALVVGRIVKEGKPMAGVAVGIVSVDRGETFTGNFDTFTDEEGKFSFRNVPPYQMYYVYSLMDKCAGEYVAPSLKVKVPGDGMRKDLGDVPLLKGARIKGRIQLADGSSLPPGVEVNLSRHGAWDDRPILVMADGSFETSGVPVEAYSLSVRVPGYAISTRNKSLDQLNGGSLVGRIDSDTYVQVLMERGDFARPDFAKLRFGPEMQPYDEPLRGVLPEGL